MFLLEGVNGAKGRIRMEFGYVKVKGKHNVIQFVRFVNGKSTYYKTPPNNILALQASHHNIKSHFNCGKHINVTEHEDKVSTTIHTLHCHIKESAPQISISTLTISNFINHKSYYHTILYIFIRKKHITNKKSKKNVTIFIFENHLSKIGETIMTIFEKQSDNNIM